LGHHRVTGGVAGDTGGDTGRVTDVVTGGHRLMGHWGQSGFKVKTPMMGMRFVCACMRVYAVRQIYPPQHNNP